MSPLEPRFKTPLIYPNQTTYLTANQAIERFQSDLELSDRQSKIVAARQSAVREVAEKSALINVHDSRLIGSYERDTQIRTITGTSEIIDVDCLLMLATNTFNLNRYWYTGDGGRQLLQDLLKSLSGYRDLSVKIDAPSITIRWLDMKMELTPAFYREGGGFFIPSSFWGDNSWQVTSPLVDAEKLTAQNKDSSGRFKPTVKMLKAWNRNLGKLFSSFTLETFCYHVSRSLPSNSIEQELTNFFRALSENNYKYFSSPSGLGNPVVINLPPHQVGLINLSSQILQDGFNLARKGQDSASIHSFARLFGKPFPGAS